MAKLSEEAKKVINEIHPGLIATLGLLNRCFGMPELNSRDAMCCLRGFKQAWQSDALGISFSVKLKEERGRLITS